MGKIPIDNLFLAHRIYNSYHSTIFAAFCLLAVNSMREKPNRGVRERM